MPPNRNGFNWLSAAPALFVGLWATGFIGSRLSAPYAEPFSFLSIRFAIVSSILLVASLVMKAKWPPLRTSLWALIIGALSQGGYLGGIFWAIYYGMPAGVAALITALQPLFTAALAGLILGEKITARHWAGLTIGLGGVDMVVWPKLTFSATGITPETLLASFMATLSITLGSIMQKRHLTNTDLRTSNSLQFAGGGLVMLVGALATENYLITWNADVIFAMTWFVLVLSIGAISILHLMIRHGEVSKVSSLFLLVPAVTAVMAYFLFAETLIPVQLAGMALCAGAVMLVTHKT